MQTQKRLLLTALLMMLALPLLSACNTTRGMGQDIEALGEKVEEEAEEKKTY